MNFFEQNYVPVDKDLMQEGAEVDFGGDFKVRIRHVSSHACEKAQNQVRHDMRVKKNGSLTSDQSRKVSKHVAAHAGIVSWSGGGAPEFSPEKALEIFEDRPEFLEDVLTAMTEYETFRKKASEDAAGN